MREERIGVKEENGKSFGCARNHGVVPRKDDVLRLMCVGSDEWIKVMWRQVGENRSPPVQIEEGFPTFLNEI